VTRPNLDPNYLDYAVAEDSRGWFMYAGDGGLMGNGMDDAHVAGGFRSWEGDRMGLLLDLDDGSLLFFKNGVQHGPGYPAGTVTGPVVHALQFYESSSAVGARLLPDAACPKGHHK
jgi:hypothetical protein